VINGLIQLALRDSCSSKSPTDPFFIYSKKTTGRREIERIEKDNKGQEKEKGRKETRYNKQERRRKVEK